MRFRITIRRVNKTELRGYHDVESIEEMGQFSAAMEPFGMVIASPATPDYNPFGITNPDYPPSMETSRDLLNGWFSTYENQEELFEHLATVHYNQALVIRGERYRADQAEGELMARELHHFEVERENAELKAKIAALRADSLD